LLRTAPHPSDVGGHVARLCRLFLTQLGSLLRRSGAEAVVSPLERTIPLVPSDRLGAVPLSAEADVPAAVPLDRSHSCGNVLEVVGDGFFAPDPDLGPLARWVPI